MMPLSGSHRADTEATRGVKSRTALMVGLALILGMLAPAFGSGSARALAVATVSPADGAHLSSIPVLQWPEGPTEAGVRVTSKYKVEISATAAFTDPLTMIVATNTATPQTDLAPLQYWWHYAGYDQDGTLGAWSESFTFTRDTDAAPSIVSPDNEFKFTYPQDPPTLVWAAVPGMDSYTVETAKDAGFTLLPKATTTTNTSLTPTALLASGLDGAEAAQPYYWRVRGNSVSGTVTTAWSDPRWFTISFPGIPSPIQPANSAVVELTLGEDEPTFEWSAVPGASQYELWIASDRQFTNKLEHPTLAGTRYTPTQTFEAGKYYWKVRALDPGGSWGDWSPADRTFTRTWLDAAHSDEIARPDNVVVTGSGGSTPLNKFLGDLGASGGRLALRGADQYPERLPLERSDHHVQDAAHDAHTVPRWKCERQP